MGEGAMDSGMMDIIKKLMAALSGSGGSDYQNNPLGYAPNSMQFMQSPMMQMARQTGMNLPSMNNPFIPYNVPYYDYLLMQERKTMQASMMPPTVPQMFPRMMGGVMQNMFGYTQNESLRMMYAPGGGQTPFAKSLTTLYNRTIGPMLEPDEYIGAHRASILNAFQGLKITGPGGATTAGGTPSYYGGLGGEGGDQIMKFLGRKAKGGTGLLKGFSTGDWADMSRMAADYGVLTSSEGLNVNQVEQRIEKMAKVIKVGMSVFNTFDKSKVLDILQNITFGEVDFGASPESAQMMMTRLSTMAAKANKSIQFMAQVAQEGGRIFKQMGYSATVGAEMYTGMRAGFSDTGRFGKDFIQRSGGLGGTFAKFAEGRMGILASGLGKQILGGYQIAKTYGGAGAAGQVRDVIDELGMTRPALSRIQEIINQAPPDVVRNAAAFAGRGLTSLQKDLGGADKALEFMERNGVTGLAQDLRSEGLDIDSRWASLGGGKSKESNKIAAEQLKQEIITKYMDRGLSFERAETYAEDLVNVKMQAPDADFKVGVDVRLQKMKKENEGRARESRLRLVFEEDRPEKINLMRRIMALDFGNLTLSKGFKRLFARRETAVGNALIRELAMSGGGGEGGLAGFIKGGIKGAKIENLRRLMAQDTALGEMLDETKLTGAQRSFLIGLQNRQGGQAAGLSDDLTDAEVEDFLSKEKTLFGEKGQTFFNIGNRVTLDDKIAADLENSETKLGKHYAKYYKEISAFNLNKNYTLEQIFDPKRIGRHKKLTPEELKIMRKQKMFEDESMQSKWQALIDDVDKRPQSIMTVGRLKDEIQERFKAESFTTPQMAAFAQLASHFKTTSGELKEKATIAMSEAANNFSTAITSFVPSLNSFKDVLKDVLVEGMLKNLGG